MYALVDCNNFYASCERVFQPKFNGKPVAILSNNDGCVIARSNEAKAVGVAMGVPAFQIKELVKKNNVKLFLMYNFNNYSFSSILDSKKTRSTYIINHENVSNNYIHNKFNKYLNLLLSNKNNLFGFLYIQDFDEFFKKSINNSITVENDQIDAIYYKQVNHFNNFFKRIYVYFYRKFFNFFHQISRL